MVGVREGQELKRNPLFIKVYPPHFPDIQPIVFEIHTFGDFLSDIVLHFDDQVEIHPRMVPDKRLTFAEKIAALAHTMTDMGV